MAKKRFEHDIIFCDSSGIILTTMRILAEGAEESDLIIVISPNEALEYGEEQVQLLEGISYQYEVSDPRFRLDHANPVIEPFLIGQRVKDYGIIKPGNRTGLFILELLQNDQIVATSGLEIRSSKLEYRNHYRAMLEDISNASVDLLFQVGAPTQVRFAFDHKLDPETLQQRLFFLRGLFGTPDFTQSVQQIISMPHSRLTIEDEEADIRKGFRGGASINRQIAAGQPRIPIPHLHPIAQILGQEFRTPSLPGKITKQKFEETIDTPENQFIKYVLLLYVDTLEAIEQQLKLSGTKGGPIIHRELIPLRQRMENLIEEDFFNEISMPAFLPLGSPVLQRKAGYREVFQSWMNFNAAATLVWRGGEEVFGGGQRDIAKLYEYWCFFVLWQIVSRWASTSGYSLNLSKLFEPTQDGLGLRLKSGEMISTEGIIIIRNGRRLRARFSYNRRFSFPSASSLRGRIDYIKSYPKSGSWTRAMQPDFTLSFWPDGIEPDLAEEQELMVHVHFDAKYKVSSLYELFGSESDDFTEEKHLQKSTAFKRDDLLKMHSYRDAIRRTQGAYVLYPGTIYSKQRNNKDQGDYNVWLEYREILPGIGAFPIKPGTDKDMGIKLLDSFLEDILDHVSDSQTRRESLALMTSKINEI